MRKMQKSLSNNHSRLISQKAFSIVELLITLTVLGIISVMIMPIVNNGYKRNTIQTTFADTIREANKGLYSYIISVTSYNAMKDGVPTTKKVQPTMSDGKLSTAAFFKGNTAEKMSSSFNKARSDSAGWTNCWGGYTVYPNFNMSGTKINLNDLPCFIDAHNIIYAIETLDSDCSLWLYKEDKNTERKNKLQNSCGILYLDLNGRKTPNTFGKDIFAFVITDSPNTYLYPVGGKQMRAIPSGKLNGVGTWENSCDETHKDGRTCAGRIIEENMTITYWR